MDEWESELKGRADIISKSFACELTVSIKERTRIARQLVPFVMNMLKAEGNQVARSCAEIAMTFCPNNGRVKDCYVCDIATAILRHRGLTENAV